MIVLGITDGITGGATIVHDGIIVAAVNEERLVRKKMAFGFPRSSIQAVLELADVQPQQVIKVAVATRNNYFADTVTAWDGWFESRKDRSFRSLVFGAVSNYGSLIGTVPGIEMLYYQLRKPVFNRRRKIIERIMREEFDITADVVFVDHHFAHATSAYYTSDFENALVVTMDGGGDGCSSHIYEVEDGRFKKLTETSSFNSLGNYYSYITAISGFKAQKHEGKITGLAAYGEPLYLDLLNSLINYHDGKIQNTGKLVFRGGIDGIKKRLPKDYHMRDLASSIQLHSEQIATKYVRYWLKGTNCRQIALAGGVFANVRINQHIYEIPEIEKIFVHPGMEDGGLAVGAALAVCHKSHNKCIEDVYLGPDYSEREIEQALCDSSLKFSRENNIEREVAALLAQGFVVARFNGRMEYGPRALGNRSILYQPTDPSVNDWLNKNLRRTEFMPFAPSTLYEYASQCYKDVSGALETARFMTITFNCTEWMKDNCSGVVHIDGTARPQLVKEDQNGSYYKIIDEFRKITGLPSIINTSFNIHEEPIVCTPQDATRAFLDSSLDYLAIGNYLVKNPKPFTHTLKPVKRVEKGTEYVQTTRKL